MSTENDTMHTSTMHENTLAEIKRIHFATHDPKGLIHNTTITDADTGQKLRIKSANIVLDPKNTVAKAYLEVWGANVNIDASVEGYAVICPHCKQLMEPDSPLLVPLTNDVPLNIADPLY